MAHIREYWINKESRAEKALEHTEEMEEKYFDDIAKSFLNTKVYSFSCQSCDEIVENSDMKIIIDDIDSVGAVMKYGGNDTAVLNFSSYKNPGGMFLKGSIAQEESLCHESFLYNVLRQFIGFYKWNNEHKNKALYLDRGLYSPNILFFRNDSKQEVSVITCAAPNKSAAQKYMGVSDEENTALLYSRIKFVLDIARANNVKTLILGAYGCGVFGQNAIEVAHAFKYYLESDYKCFDTVVFAIPDGKNRNLLNFKSVFKEYL